MGHGYPLDAHFALYFGTIQGTIIEKNGDKNIKWKVDMPGNGLPEDIKGHMEHSIEIIPFPNALSLLGFGNPLWLPNGLGGELKKQGVAKSFDINTTWVEKFSC